MRKPLKRAERRAWIAWKRTRQRLAPRPAGVPATILVAGNQRSGTNMLMNLLDRSALTDVYHERDSRAYRDYQLRETDVIQALRAGSRAPRFVIKALCELHRLPSLLEEFAPARCVWLFRHYNDVANSMTRSFRGFSAELASLARDPSSVGWRGLGMSGDTHRRLRTLAALDLDEVNAAAVQWYYRNVLFFEQRLDRDPRVLALRYEDLVTRPDAAIAGVLDFLEIPGTRYMVRPVFGSSVGKNQPPGLLPEVRELCEGLWQRVNAGTAPAGGA